MGHTDACKENTCLNNKEKFKEKFVNLISLHQLNSDDIHW